MGRMARLECLCVCIVPHHNHRFNSVARHFADPDAPVHKDAFEAQFAAMLNDVWAQLWSSSSRREAATTQQQGATPSAAARGGAFGG